MIWFDIKQLERKLRLDNVPDREAFYYLLATMLMMVLTPYMGSNDYHYTWLSYIEATFGLLITSLGIKKCYDVNTAGDNVDFFRRYICLSFVMGIRLVVFVVLIGIPIAIVAIAIEETMPVNDTVTDVLKLTLGMAVGIGYYYFLYKSFARVSQPIAHFNSPPAENKL